MRENAIGWVTSIGKIYRGASGSDGASSGYLDLSVSRETFTAMGWIALHNSRHSLKPTVISPCPAWSRISLWAGVILR